MAQHEFVIPGLDRQKCGKCGKWVCREIELERLKSLIERTSPKQIMDRRKEYDLEVYLTKNCGGN